MVPAVAAIGKNAAAILTDRRQRENKCGRFRDKHLKFQSYLKEIMHPAVVSLHACQSAGRGRGRAQASPLYGDGALSDNQDISHSMPPLYALYSASVIPIETRKSSQSSSSI